MRHVITGGSGFTGTYLALELARQGERVLIFDLAPPPASSQCSCEFVQGDVRSREDLARINLLPDDVVYHLAARQFHLAVPKRDQDEWFSDVNVNGTQCVLDAMESGGATGIVFVSTDMVYGWPQTVPLGTDHRRQPLGPYGRSKLRAEELLIAGRRKGLKATIFRPRLISGPGRLGILTKLFWLIEHSLPVPLIGTGRNCYQMVAVEDCVSAMLAAVGKGLPPGPFNLGSDEPPQVRDLLRHLIDRAHSKSFLVPTWGPGLKATLGLMNKIGMPILHPEQYLIADAQYVLDTGGTKEALGWKPKHSDTDMLVGAYNVYRKQGKS